MVDLCAKKAGDPSYGVGGSMLDTLNGAHLPTDDGSHTYMLVQHQWRPTSSGE